MMRGQEDMRRGAMREFVTEDGRNARMLFPGGSKKKLNDWHHRCSSWSGILSAGGGPSLINKVRTLLQWDPEARGGGFITLTPCVPRYDEK